MSYRDDDDAWKARMAALERTAAEAEELRERLWTVEARNRELEARLAELEPAPPAPPFEVTAWSPTAAPPPPYDFDDTALDTLEAAADWDALAERLREHVTRPDPAHRTAALLRLAVIYQDRLADEESAVDALRAALEIAPTSAPAFVRLHGILDRLERHIEVVELIEHRVAATWDPVERARLLLELGRRYRDCLGDHASADEAFARALDLGG